MVKRINTIKGIWGQLIHYQDGVKVGESWPGLFDGSYEHYDANGKYAGYSDPSFFADLVHHDEHGSCIGETYDGLLGGKTHYDVNGYVGSSHPSFWGGDNTTLNDIYE